MDCVYAGDFCFWTVGCRIRKILVRACLIKTIYKIVAYFLEKALTSRRDGAIIQAWKAKALTSFTRPAPFGFSGGQPGRHYAFRLPKANAMARVVSFAKEGAKEAARAFQFAHLIEEGKVL